LEAKNFGKAWKLWGALGKACTIPLGFGGNHLFNRASGETREKVWRFRKTPLLKGWVKKFGVISFPSFWEKGFKPP